jgi:excisionase family DNA binding protein
MTNRRPIGAKDPPVNADGEDNLIRLIRTIARQAAKEALNVFKDAAKTPSSLTGLPNDPPEVGNRSDNTATNANAPELGERLLSVAEVAVRLDVSSKTVRRMIDRGDLRLHRIGRLVRVGERSLADYLGKAK